MVGMQSAMFPQRQSGQLGVRPAFLLSKRHPHQVSVVAIPCIAFYLESLSLAPGPVLAFWTSFNLNSLPVYLRRSFGRGIHTATACRKLSS